MKAKIFIVIFIIFIIGTIIIFLYKANHKQNVLLDQEEDSSSLNLENEKYANIEEGHINLNKISIDIDYTSVSNKGVTIIVTDNNDENLPWTEGFRIQKKENEAWIDLEPINDLITPAISHWKDENNQYKQSIDWSYCYGELNVGEYRIVKPIFNPQNNSYIDFYSDAFKINK
jgi:hypothetical protein